MLKHLIRTAALFWLVSLCALPIHAQDETNQDAQAQIDAVFDRGAHLVTATSPEHGWPLFTVNIDGQPSLFVYDTGTTQTVLFRELFDTVPLDLQPETDLPIEQRWIQPVKFQLHPDSKGFNIDYPIDSSWDEFGFPSYVQPFFSGLLAPITLGGTPTAFERNPDENWFALFESPHDPEFSATLKIGMTPNGNNTGIALLKVRLPGSDELKTLRLLVDTGFNGDLSLKSELFAPGTINGEAGLAHSTIVGQVPITYIENVGVQIGKETIELNSVAVAEDPRFASSELEFDGLLGSEFLNRFHHVIDVAAGALILEMDGADLSPSRKYTPGGPGIAPFPNWDGGVIILSLIHI